VSVSKDLFYKAKSLYQEKKYQRALEIYKNLSILHPNYYRVWNNLGLCYVRLNDYKKAIVSFEKALEVNEKKELIWSNLGKAYYHNGEFSKVIGTYERALKIYPNNTFFWNGIGAVYIELNHYNDAIKAFKQALDVDQKSHTAWYNLCTAYGKKGVDFSSTEFKPNSEVSWHQLSKALLISSFYEDSLDAINRALSINPSFNAAFILRNKIRAIIKEKEKLSYQKHEIKVDIIKEVEKDTYYERFKKLQEKRKKQESKSSLQKKLAIEERFKIQQEKFKRRMMQIEDTIDTEPVESQKPKLESEFKPIKQFTSKSKFIYINEKYLKTDDCNFVVDGANVAREGRLNEIGGRISNLYKLFQKLNDFGIKNYMIICDRALNYTIDIKEEYQKLIKDDEIIETPGGTEADHFILKYAKDHDAYIISNDLFREFRVFFGKKWIKERRISFKFIGDKLYFDKIYTVS